MVTIENIAHQLALLNRWVRHNTVARQPYSVAAHCCVGHDMFAYHGWTRFAKAFLIHEEPEAFYGADLDPALKAKLGLDVLERERLEREAPEHGVEAADVFSGFVKAMDVGLARAEAAVLLKTTSGLPDWYNRQEPCAEAVTAVREAAGRRWGWRRWKAEFLQRWRIYK